MKYTINSSDNSSYVSFSEQVTQLTSFYEQWNDCERTVVISALFKRLPFANLKFLLHSIDHHLKQSITTPRHELSLLEEAGNAVSFLNKLVHKYNTIANLKSSSDNIDMSSDPELSGNDNIKSLENDLVSKYTNKEEIVQDLLMYLPLLRPNNDEARKVYVQFLPIIAEDSMKYILPIELIQQILSYLLIHPSIKNDERKTLQQWSQKLQDHISMSFNSTNSIGGSSNVISFLPADNMFTSTGSSNNAMSSASSSSSASSTTWPTAVPQIQTQPINNDMFKLKREHEREFWDLRNFQVTQDFCDDLNLNQQANQQTKYNPLPIGNNSASQNSLNNSKGINNTTSSIFDVNDEHHISFSKNGTDVDFENDFSDSTSKSTSLTVVPANNTSDFLTVPNFFSDRIFDIYGYSGASLSDGLSDDGSVIKTRRSNSLTTPTASGDLMMSSSAENLANLQKPRSFSLTTETSRNALMSCGSETRLDKLVQFRLNNNSQHIGMGNVAAWLKSLRLHKYLWLFTNLSYDQMMEMTEEYLETLGVTKGARHKLVLCIQKLPERVKQLKQIEKELTDGTKQLKVGLDDLGNVILSPMKPINSVPCDEDVATHVMRVLDCAFLIVQGIKYFTGADEDSVNAFIWVLDKALHHDAFLQQTAHLKEYKFKLQRIKSMFGNSNKMYNGNNNTNNMNKGGNNIKNRWIKGKMNNQNTSDNQKIRKNSMPYYNIQPYQQNQNNKSLSYPNFGNTQAANLSNFQRSASREKLNQFTLMQQQHHVQFNQQQNNNGANTPIYQQHRNSLNNLNPFTIQQQQQFSNRRNSSCGTDRMTINASLQAAIGMNNASSNEKVFSDSGMSTSPMLGMTALPPGNTTTSDINSRLESLCRQMTEQAIN